MRKLRPSELVGMFLNWVFSVPPVRAVPASRGLCLSPLWCEFWPVAPLSTVPASPWPSCHLPGSNCAAHVWRLEEATDFGGVAPPRGPCPSLLRASSPMGGTGSLPLPLYLPKGGWPSLQAGVTLSDNERHSLEMALSPPFRAQPSEASGACLTLGRGLAGRPAPASRGCVCGTAPGLGGCVGNGCFALFPKDPVTAEALIQADIGSLLWKALRHMCSWNRFSDGAKSITASFPFPFGLSHYFKGLSEE